MNLFKILKIQALFLMSHKLKASSMHFFINILIIAFLSLGDLEYDSILGRFILRLP